MRDDILAWYSKSVVKNDIKTQELEKQLVERVLKNVANIQLKFAECVPEKNKDKTKMAEPKGYAYPKVMELYQNASSDEKLCAMPTIYHPWL